jgi:predicted nucleic acid-binding protein
MPFVIDASIIVGWYAPSQASEMGWLALDQVAVDTAHVPPHALLESLGALRRLERRGILAPETVDAARRTLVALAFAVDDREAAASAGAWLDLSRRFDLSVYDAAYLELAGRLDAPLVTRDSAIARAAAALELPRFAYSPYS